MKYILIFTITIRSTVGFCQPAFETDPAKTQFITSDIPRFWEAFDRMDSVKNPFRNYLENGSAGLRDFIPYRIESPKNLLKTVKKRKSDYEAIRKDTYKVKQYTGQVRNYYKALKEIYNEAIFPPAYFVIGTFNSGGTSTDNGLIMGVEMQSEMENIPYIVAHELIHFNQHYPDRKTTLLEHSIMEGSADFIGELISGRHLDDEAFQYGDENEKLLCTEFVQIMEDYDYHGWLYGSKGKKKGKPNDLGYWIGYKICQSYYDRASNKRDAIRDILNIKDFKAFLDKSGYLSAYINK